MATRLQGRLASHAMSTIIVGVDDSPRSEDAVALAGTLARAAGADIVAVCAFPYDDRPEAHFNLAMRALLLERAEHTLDRLCEALNDDAARPPARRGRPQPRPRRSKRVAREEDAALIVVGSSHTGHLGRLYPGSTAERLLQGAPCPVALAPQGYRIRPTSGLRRVTVGYDGLPRGRSSRSAPRRAIARATGASLRVIRVFTRDWPIAAVGAGRRRATCA